MTYWTVDEMRERIADWEAFAQDPEAPPDEREMYAELVAIDRAEIERRERISF